MDLNSTYAPPINNACVPDIYNRLDADVIERTRVANNQLNMRLMLQQKILLKYKQEAERFQVVEKSRVVRELARISQRLPTVDSLHAFDESVNHSEHGHPHTHKSYMAAKNDDPVCRRCYIHHLPSKRQFYKFRAHQLPPAVPEARTSYNITGNRQLGQKMATKSITSTTQERTEKDSFDDTNDSVSNNGGELYIHDQMKKPTDRFLPAVDAFKFLNRDKWSRSVELNHGDTPRLMPNELWKNFVKTISSQYLKHQDLPSSTARHQHDNDSVFGEKTPDNKSGFNDRRSSIMSANKSEQLLNRLRGSNSRINLNRRMSIATERQAKEKTHSQTNSTAPRQETIGSIDSSRKPPLSKTNSFSRSLSRGHEISSSTTHG